ncbi:Bcr/CflA family efflux MFS transporter [Stella sp.]|uniref:Bcr/CflA family efflux MFS transporter n=1 Tax=Stella sp. TaxID=2912054 RepID=UPI0035B13DA1
MDRPRRLPPLWLLIAATGVGAASLHIILPSLPRIATEFASDYGSAQLALTVYLAAMAPAQLLYGPLSDRYGRRPLLLLGLSGYLFGTMLCVYAWSLEVLLAGRAIQAFGGCAGMVLARAIVRDVHDRERSAGLIAHITMAMSLAPMFAPALGGWLEVWVGWRVGFLLLGAAGATTLVAAWFRLNETLPAPVPIAPRAMVRHYGLLIRSRPFVGYTLGTALATASWYAFTAGAPYLLVEALGESPGAYGTWILLAMGGYTVGNLIASRRSQHLGVDRMLIVGSAIGIAATLWLVLWVGLGGLTALALFVPVMLLTFGQGMTQPNGIAGAISVHPHIAGAASGLLGFVQMVVSALATLFLAAIQAPVAWPTVGVLAVCVVLSTLAFLCAILPERRPAVAKAAPPAPTRARARAEPQAEPMPEPSAIWSGLTPDELEYQYNPQRAVPHFKDYQAEREPANARARAKLECHRDIAYAEGPLRDLDIYPVPGATGTAVHIFVHGGYWRAQDKANFAFVAEHLVAHGIATVVVNYPLCPAVTLDGVVASALDAVAWTARNARSFGGDPRRITLSGHSAGAHLGAAAIAADWTLRDLPRDLLQGAVLISGIYDPAPAMRTTVNADLKLTPAIARRHNYELATPHVRCPVEIMAGGQEPSHWIDQSFRYAHHLGANGMGPGVRVSPGFHHFDIMNQYQDPDSDVLRAILRLARR